ncbi:hypothetical protein M6I34_14495 [Burkholderiaceae bacterium FT117]|uniref:glucosamine inositolphosphorylceramide transferase family protein n=1 Tax=Zeimonas sediminis TaxID=2944268 RepID=UPI002342E384|nr:hypothetical protein [Zeimonas sediminis]MCM5571727.1 hypothetical protein [Zeimonas sediminis]
MRLRIGLVVDSALQGWNVHALLDWAAARDDLAITHLLVDRGRDTGGSASGEGPGRLAAASGGGFPSVLSKRTFPFLAKAESLLAGRAARESLEKRDVSGKVPAVIDLDSGSSAARLSESGVDLLVVFGSWRPRAEALASTRLGLVSVEHEGEIAGSPETAGFWQTFFGRDSTGYAILARGRESGGEAVLASGRVWNRVSFVSNRLVAQRKSLHRLRVVLAGIAATRRMPEAPARAHWSNPPQGGPGIGAQAAYLGVLLRRLAGKAIRRHVSGRAPRWSVFLARGDWPRLDARAATRIENPKGGFLADPFLLDEGGRTYCFVEELHFSDQRGFISAYEIGESGATRIGKVIAEPFHMSFPYVFRHGSRIFMVPETSENRDVRLYECVRVPDRWELRKILMSGVSTVDTMIFERGGRWWMFTNLDEPDAGDLCSELHIFYADDPLSDRWIPHRMNPVSLDASRARNGGILLREGAIYRVSQRQGFDTHGYGEDFSINRIDVLTPDDYAETEVLDVRPTGLENPARIHHIQSNGRFSVFDRCRMESVRT